MDGDLPKAYDNVLHPLVSTRLCKRGYPKFVGSAILRETRRQRVRITMGDVTSDVVKRTKSLCQGSSDAPKIFNQVFDVDILEFVKTCRKKKWGFPISQNVHGVFDDFLPIIVFADNFWILAKSPSELQMMSDIWFSRCAFAGWDIPHDDCAWSSTLPDDECRWTLRSSRASH